MTLFTIGESVVLDTLIHGSSIKPIKLPRYERSTFVYTPWQSWRACTVYDRWTVLY